MFIKRDITALIKEGSKQAPVLAIIGPRQSGKSTLAKEMFKDYRYLDMQDIELFEFANADPKGFLATYKSDRGIIIDEAQYAPQLFSQIKVEVDKERRPGHYILSGSQNFLLHEKISESLAGRAYFYKLLPLSIHELREAALLSEDSQDQVFKGFYPGVYQPFVDAPTFYGNYISTYVERDIRSVRNIENIITFKKFIQLCALRTGTVLNITDLATQCGISQNTARGWLSLLEASFILFLLPSYHDNLGKRVTKSPKLYFYDVGLAAHLMGMTRDVLTKNRVIYGALFENMIVVDVLKTTYSYNIPAHLSFYRDSNQHEVDLIIEASGMRMPIEIKASQAMQSGFFKTLEWFAKETQNALMPTVIYAGNQNQMRTHGRGISWKNVDHLIKSLA